MKVNLAAPHVSFYTSNRRFIKTRLFSPRQKELAIAKSRKPSRSSSFDPRNDRKTLQLCRQVLETLEMVLSGEIDDDRLPILHVVEVVPAPDSSRMLVTLSADIAAADYDPDEIINTLSEYADLLRMEVAAAINRKKAPQLMFHLAPAYVSPPDVDN